MAVRLMRPRFDAEKQHALADAAQRADAAQAKLRAENVQLELGLEEARISFRQLLNAMSEEPRAAVSRAEAKVAAAHLEIKRLSALCVPLLAQAVVAPRDFAETQPMGDEFADRPPQRTSAAPAQTAGRALLRKV